MSFLNASIIFWHLLILFYLGNTQEKTTSYFVTIQRKTFQKHNIFRILLQDIDEFWHNVLV